MMMAPVAGASPTRPSAVPTNSFPFAYTGEEPPSGPTGARQRTASAPALPRPSRFSYGLKQLRPPSKQPCSQSVRTRKTARADTPLDCPTASTA